MHRIKLERVIFAYILGLMYILIHKNNQLNHFHEKK